jgi:hypothetical protein
LRDARKSRGGLKRGGDVELTEAQGGGHHALSEGCHAVQA